MTTTEPTAHMEPETIEVPVTRTARVALIGMVGARTSNQFWLKNPAGDSSLHGRTVLSRGDQVVFRHTNVAGRRFRARVVTVFSADVGVEVVDILPAAVVDGDYVYLVEPERFR